MVVGSSPTTASIMKKYIYTDNTKKQVIFECTAESILDADKMINLALGIKVEKLGNIGCDFEEIENGKECIL